MTYRTHEEVSAIRYTQPKLDGKWLYVPITREPLHERVSPWHPTYRDMLLPFDSMLYTCPRIPIDLGLFNRPGLARTPNVLRMLIKRPHSEVRIPIEFKRLEKVIARLLSYDARVNPIFSGMFVHLTHDTSAADPEEHHRFPGWHGDGFQGAQFSIKHTCEHSYILTSDPATEVCLQPFFVNHYNEATENVFLAFDQQAEERNVARLLPEHFYLFDPYVVHRSPLIKRLCVRTFLRITLTTHELEVDKNTVNPAFSGQKYPARQDIREELREPGRGIPLDGYGLSL